MAQLYEVLDYCRYLVHGQGVAEADFTPLLTSTDRQS